MSTIGKFIVSEVQAEWLMYPYSVTIRLQSNGPIDPTAWSEIVGTNIELRRTPKGLSAYGRIVDGQKWGTNT